MNVSYAVGLPNVGEFGDPRVLAELAVARHRGAAVAVTAAPPRRAWPPPCQ